jgi:hypothetical protein
MHTPMALEQRFRPPMCGLRRFAEFAFVALFATTAFSQNVGLVSVSKDKAYFQNNVEAVQLGVARSPCNFGCPLRFAAYVVGGDMGRLAAPVLSGPVNVGAIGSAWNGGLMSQVSSNEWRIGNGNWDYSPTPAGLDAVFPSGTYTINVGGKAVALNLAGEAYPNPPVLGLSGGAWIDGMYVVNPSRTLNIVTNAFDSYGAHRDGRINLYVGADGKNLAVIVQNHSSSPSSNRASITIPPGTLVDGGQYYAGASFAAVVDINANGVPGAQNVAEYRAITNAMIRADASFTGGTPTIPPVFPMTVTSNITATTASATASIQARSEDVGASASVYVFAVAPSNLVKVASADAKLQVVGKSLSLSGSKDAPPECVLAQVNSSGQLIAVTSAQLQAYSSGTLSASGTNVTILNNASTPAVAGATFYVGYGASSTAMLTNGVYRNAVTVPGSGVCPMVSSQTALWWNPAESGWGLNLNQQGNTLFATLFTYETGRAPLWLVMSNGVLLSDGVTFAGDLYRTTGPAFNANPFTPIGPSNLTKVGTMTVSFIDVNTASLTYTVNGTTVNKAITRQVFGSRAAACFPSTASRVTATNYQDLWWVPNGAESGWGINVTHQGDTLFATLFTYDAAGKGLWLVMSSGTKQADGSYSGTLYRTAGPAFDAIPFTPIGTGDLTTVGTMRLAFSDGVTGTLSYTYNGAPVTKSIKRQEFSSPLPACN